MLKRVWLWITRPGPGPRRDYDATWAGFVEGPFPHGEGGYRQLSTPQSPCAPVCRPCAVPGGSCVVAGLYGPQTGGERL